MSAPPGPLHKACLVAAIGVVEIHLIGLADTVLLAVVAGAIAVCVLAYRSRRPR